MARGGKRGAQPGGKKSIELYEHPNKRANNRHLGLVKPENDLDAGKERYAYDPYLDPQLVWAEKAEHTSSEVPTAPLNLHERIDPKMILEAVRRTNGAAPHSEQIPLSARPEENAPLREAPLATRSSDGQMPLSKTRTQRVLTRVGNGHPRQRSSCARTGV